MSSTTSNFDLTQTAFLFSWFANYSSSAYGTEEQMANFVYDAINGTNTGSSYNDVMGLKTTPGLLPYLNDKGVNYDPQKSWELKWGPGVFTIDRCTQRADNTAYVVYNKTINTYIVAIAGTDPNSLKNWLVEDFQVGKNQMYDWPEDILKLEKIMDSTNELKGMQASEKIAQISLGTAFGIQALGSKLVLAVNAPQSGFFTLIDFLKQDFPSGTKIIFTGHSLGGALSPTLAKWTLDWQSLKSKVMPEEARVMPEIFAMPTAGPTPGNGEYQKMWDENFGSDITVEKITGNVGVNSGNIVTKLNFNVCNNFDVVPHAWDRISSEQFVKNNSETKLEERTFFCAPPIKVNSEPCQFGVVKTDKTLDTIYLQAFKAFVHKMKSRGIDGNMTSTKNLLAFDPSELIGYYDNDKKREKRQLIIETIVCDPNVNRHRITNVLKTSVLGKGDEIDDLHPYLIEDNGIEKLLLNIGMTHVWGYLTAAFNIDFSVAKELNAYPVS